MSAPGHMMTTLDGSKSFNGQISCPGSDKIVEIFVVPAGTGDLGTVIVSEDTTFSGSLNYSLQLPFPVSGVCANGVIACNPGTWNSCSYYTWVADSTRKVSLAQVADISKMGGCFCINNSCGTGLAWTNMSMILTSLGGGVTGALQATDARYAISNVQTQDTLIQYFGQSTGSCNMASSSGTPSATNPQGYYGSNGNGGYILSGDVETAKNGAASDPNSMYNLITQSPALANTNVTTASCAITRGVTCSAGDSVCPVNGTSYNGGSGQCEATPIYGCSSNGAQTYPDQATCNAVCGSSAACATTAVFTPSVIAVNVSGAGATQSGGGCGNLSGMTGSGNGVSFMGEGTLVNINGITSCTSTSGAIGAASVLNGSITGSVSAPGNVTVGAHACGLVAKIAASGNILNFYSYSYVVSTGKCNGALMPIGSMTLGSMSATGSVVLPSADVAVNGNACGNVSSINFANNTMTFYANTYSTSASDCNGTPASVGSIVFTLASVGCPLSGGSTCSGSPATCSATQSCQATCPDNTQLVGSACVADALDGAYAEGISDNCSAIANDSSCKLRDESVDGVYTYQSYNPTGLTPQSSCTGVIVNRTAACNESGLHCGARSYTCPLDPSIGCISSMCSKQEQYNVCHEWWTKQRTYVCQGNAYDFSDIQKRVQTIRTSATDTGSAVYYNDYRQNQDGSWGSENHTVQLGTRDTYGSCEVACKIKRVTQLAQTGNSGNTSDVQVDNTRIDFLYKSCVNNACPIENAATDTIITNCQCINEFAEAASVFQMLRLAGQDFVCSSGNAQPLK